MMEGLPVKFRFLELFVEAEKAWNSDVIPIMQKEYGMENTYGRDVLNYALIEMSASGFIKPVFMKEDEDGTYKKGAPLTQYEITDIGRKQFDDLKKGVKLQKV